MFLPPAALKIFAREVGLFMLVGMYNERTGHNQINNSTTQHPVHHDQCPLQEVL
jgi:hypothetical protein